jgi:hypothetical protein
LPACLPACLPVCLLACLQIFKVPGKGWGVRCAVDIPAGAVLCKYTGVVITDK